MNLGRFRVFKPRGSFELDPASSYSGLRMRIFRGGSIEERILPQRDHFQLQMDHISNAIMNGGEILTPGEEGLKDMRAIEAIYKAAESGQTVKL